MDAWLLGISDPLEHFAPLSATQPTTFAFGTRGDVQEWPIAATAGRRWSPANRSWTGDSLFRRVFRPSCRPASITRTRKLVLGAVRA